MDITEISRQAISRNCPGESEGNRIFVLSDEKHGDCVLEKSSDYGIMALFTADYCRMAIHAMIAL